ncbi:MAG: hypothetical protein JXL97_11700 [Bacteroidales bacterium]|nr:hypothetical protein [Bacteroidales bacterium]
MQIIHKDKYMVIEFDEDRKITFSKWTKETKSMTNKEMREAIVIASSLMKKYKPKYYLANERDRLFPYSKEIQSFVAETLINAGLEVGLLKFAIISPTDILVEFTTHQTAEIAKNVPIEVKHFKLEETAISWLNEVTED